MSGAGTIPPLWAQCATLARRGLPPAEIAVAVGASRESVYSLLSYARKRGVAVPQSKGGGPGRGPRVSVSQALLDRLDGPAAARGLTVRELAAAVLAAVAEGGLVDAVLDDLGDPEGG